MNPISNTAWYCCGVRMDDARRPDSLCNDHYAQRFMNEQGLRIYEPFRSETMPNLSNAVRCRIIDDLVQAEIAQDSSTRIVTIGAGFDTRPYRLAGGDWVEIDEPQIIEHKNTRLPVAECPHPLRRIAIDFATGSLDEVLAGIGNGRPVVFVIEGVFMYLEESAIAQTLATLLRHFPRQVLVCDLMSRRFFEKFGASIHRKLVTVGASFTPRPDDPAAVMRRSGYFETDVIPMMVRAMEWGVLGKRAHIPRPVARFMLWAVPDLKGFAVVRFVPAGSSAA
jgi:methyltransferase (TIGR00027 family)